MRIGHKTCPHHKPVLNYVLALSYIINLYYTKVCVHARTHTYGSARARTRARERESERARGGGVERERERLRERGDSLAPGRG